jgi:hypothetical protein
VRTGNRGNIPVLIEDDLAGVVQHGSKPRNRCEEDQSNKGGLPRCQVGNDLEMPPVRVGISAERVGDHANKVDMLSRSDSIALRVEEGGNAYILSEGFG